LKITFIRLNMFEHISSDAMKPILFGLIYNLTPKTFELEFLDERVKPLPETIDSDIIAFSVETYTAKRAYIMARKYKTPKNRIVMGGFHPSVLPDEVLKYADTVLIGDAEDTWPELLQDCLEGTYKQIYQSKETCKLESSETSVPIYKHKYHNIGVYQASRGCKFHCDFCSIKTLYQNVRQKPLEMVYEELKAMKEKIIFFADDNLFLDEASAINLFRTIAPLKKKWACQISMDVAKNDQLLFEMKKAGCFLVLIGFETLDPKGLQTMNKAANKSMQNYEEVIAKIHKHRMLIYGTFVFGYDTDTQAVFEKTYDFAVKNRLAVTNFNVLIPMPGTKVYERLEKENRLRYKKWWLSDQFRYGEAAYTPALLTPEQLYDGCHRIRSKFYSISCIMKRLVLNPAHYSPRNMMIYCLINFISKKEIRAKRAQLLGGILNESDVD